MEHLWTPWRSTYMKKDKTANACIFCAAAAELEEDEANLVVYRGHHCFVILNRYPYTSGHSMVAPYAHVSRLNQASEDAIQEMTALTRRLESVIEQAYHPDGINLGMNLGRAAGAGIAEHIHMHMLPRWYGDANFMTSVADARIIPESMDETYSKIRDGLAKQT